MPSLGEPISPLQDKSPHPPTLSARAVHREQVWAALIRAVDFLLNEALEQLEDDLERAQHGDDAERIDRLLGRLRSVKELRREVSAPPP